MAPTKQAGRARAAVLGSLIALFAVAGCGSGSSSPGDGGPRDTGSASGTGTLTWKENGTMHTALFPSAAFARNSTLDFLQITGGDSTGGGTAVSFGVAVRPPPLGAGTYACGGTGYPIVSLTYTGADLQQPVTCMITLASVGTNTGDRATGTFTASLAATGGGTKTITEGHFDLPETVATQ